MFFFLLTCVSVCICIVFCYLPKHLLKWWGCLVWSGHFWHHGRLYAGSRQLLQARNFYYPFHINDQYRHHHLILVVSILKKSPSSILWFMVRHQKKYPGFWCPMYTWDGGGPKTECYFEYCIFSCPGHLNKWHCRSLGLSGPTNNQSLRSLVHI